VTTPFIIDSGPSARGWHWYANFLRCPMLFFWRHVYAGANSLGFNDVTAHLARGTLVHVGLAHRYAHRWAEENGRDPEMALEWYDAIRVKASQLGTVGARMLPVATSMLNAYLRRYPTETFKVVAIEEPVEIRFGSALYTARLDRVVREMDGKVWIHDVKTTSRLRSDSLRQYTLHGQFFGFNYLGKKYYGDDFGGVIIDMISEDGTCVRKTAEPAPFALRTFPDLIALTNDRIESVKKMFGVDSAAWMSIANPDEQTCFGKYKACPCVELCRWGRQ
jgi:hypothetical protein